MDEALTRINILKLLAHALTIARPFVKLNSEQSAAWELVQSIAEGES